MPTAAALLFATRLGRSPARRRLARAFASTPTGFKEQTIPAVFYRGGTSKGLFFSSSDLPAGQAKRDALFLSAMGSPDPNGRQLDGMGGGYSSVSKVVIVGPSAHESADVDYTFVQVNVTTPVVDYGGNCGNLLSAVGPFALEQRIAAPSIDDNHATVRVLNTNTNKLINVRFPVDPNVHTRPFLSGEFSIDGVSGQHARISLDFVNPAGSRTAKLFPTENVADTLALPDGQEVQVTLMDCGNPCVFVRAADIGVNPTVLPPQLDGDKAALKRLDDLRNAAAVAMGLVPNLEKAAAAKSVPKVVIVSPPSTHKVLSGETLDSGGVDVITRAISAGDPHRALPITASLCTAAAAQVPGTLVREATRESRVAEGGVVIGHASGTIMVDANVKRDDKGQWTVPTARVYRTARKLFEGRVFYNDDE